MESAAEPVNHERDRDTLKLNIFAPSALEPKLLTFPDDETVGAAAERAAREFGLHPTAPSFTAKGGDVLDRTKTLEQVDVHNGETLELVDVGGGV